MARLLVPCPGQSTLLREQEGWGWGPVPKHPCSLQELLPPGLSLFWNAAS